MLLAYKLRGCTNLGHVAQDLKIHESKALLLPLPSTIGISISSILFFLQCLFIMSFESVSLSPAKQDDERQNVPKPRIELGAMPSLSRDERASCWPLHHIGGILNVDPYWATSYFDANGGELVV
ncbi:hypothetical protein LY78DRAFT_75447 [Colletotrichum sublineola]|nr:hypothetical protein LY78DRAFT_75447 [Colletotrichum sublineola]